MADLVTLADPDVAVLVPELPQADRPALPLLHPRKLLPAAGRVQPVLPVGGRPACSRSGSARTSPESRTTTACTGFRWTARTGPEVLRARRLVLGTGTSPYIPRRLRAGLPGCRRTCPPQRRLPGAEKRTPAAAEHHHRGQRPERGGDLLRAAAGHRRPRVPAQLGHPLRPVLPAGVHQAHPGDDLAGVCGLLPRAPAGPARRPHQEPEEPLQGHQLRAHRRHLRPPLHQEPLRHGGHPAADAFHR